ncbi:ABC transporter ATP-binding protein [Saccharopolyspora endophytica]|uniref:ATP-binding cassette domain-containing protein n=1 Tax=Saccharopolyspora endophytica TaxID=543886 RepID=A0ABS5DH35_9PSEU|nr:oligopeptide/dipeptide ABC transporter ATP-binding protein [Saccharopolyspora endophytica]MBQ0925596.1 ATP-binding cassette domain-containing protein [Saccharopolyspora endophytica]
MNTPMLQAEGLRVTFPGSRRGVGRGKRSVTAVDDVSLHIERGETLGLVGESGSGKSTTGRAVLKLVALETGAVQIDGQDLTHSRGAQLRRLRRQSQMVFQDPYSSLDPSTTVGASIAEPLRVHESMSKQQRRDRVVELLDLVGLRPSHADRYPYEFSGGQRQRVAIARALALNPRLIVCDEAVSALDVSTQNQVINLLEDLRERFELSYLFIAHDLAVVRHISHRVAVMYLGRIVETGPVERIYEQPAHPYTQALLSAIPAPDPKLRGTKRIFLSGDIPDPSAPPPGCPFHTRCAHAMDICSRERPAMTPIEGGGEAACHLQTSGPRLAGQPLSATKVPS